MLLVRKSLERAKMESPLLHIVEYCSYGEFQDRMEACGSPLSRVIAAEQWPPPWTMADMLRKRLPDVNFVSADILLARLRAVKNPYELDRTREAGARHHRAVTEYDCPRLVWWARKTAGRLLPQERNP